jgi:hypothetical protein
MIGAEFATGSGVIESVTEHQRIEIPQQRPYRHEVASLYNFPLLQQLDQNLSD